MAQTQDNVEKVDVTDVLQLFKSGTDTIYAAKSDLNGYVATETGKGLSSNDFTNSYKQKLDSVDTSTYLAKSDAATIYAAISDLNGKLDSDATAASATKATQDGAGNIIANTYLTTSAAASTYLSKTDAQSTYVTIQTGKGLSSNDYTTAEKNKLANIDLANATVKSAASLNSAQSLKVSLNSTSAQSFNGSSAATVIGVGGTLPVANGGTGQTVLSAVTVGKANSLATSQSLKVSLNSTSAQSFNGSAAATVIGVGGTLPVANGGTGVSKLDSITVGGANRDGDGNVIKNFYASKTEATSKLIVGASTSTVNAATTNGSTYLRLFDGNTARNSIKIAGSGNVTVSSDSSGNITVGSLPQASLSVSSSHVIVGKSSGSATITVSGGSGGTISASSNNTSIATVSVSGTSITINGKSAGSTSILISQAATSNFAAPASVYIAVDVTSVSPVLNDNTWAQISDVSKNGQGDLYWDVGDAKEITLNGNIGSQLTLSNTKLCVFILHFNYAMNGTSENNIIWGGFKSDLTNGKDVALVDAKVGNTLTDGTVCFNMNHWGNNNYGGWKGCDLRYDILGATSTPPSDYGKQHTTSNVGYDATSSTLTSPKADTLLAALPSDLRSVLRLWTRWVDAVGNGTNIDANIQATVDAITLLAEFEIFGSITYANTYEKNHQTRMAYYAAGNGRVRYNYNGTSVKAAWWECSPYRSGGSAFCRVTSANGGVYAESASVSYALAPAFKT